MSETAIALQSADQPQAAALETPQGVVTYAQFDAAIAQCATALSSEGVTAGQIVLILDSRPFVHWCLIFAAEQLGCVSVSGDALHTVRPDIVLAETGAISGYRTIVTDVAWIRTVLALPVASRPVRKIDADAIVRIVLTSGTTGLPKQVGLTRPMVDFRIGQFLASYIPPKSRMLSTMGINSIGGYIASQAVWASGGSMIYGQGKQTAQSVAMLKPTFLLMAPIQLQHLLNDLPADFGRRDDLRIAVGGSAISQGLIRDAMGRLTADLVIGYGSTEAGATAATPARNVIEQSGSVGPVLPGARLEVVDEKDTALSANHTGRLRVRAEGMVSHYLGEDDSTGDGAFRDGWFYPGDLGLIRDDGTVVLHGRDDDVLNLGGVKVSAFMLEELISDGPGIADAAVFADHIDSDPMLLVAAVVLAPGSDLASVKAAASPRLPQTLHFISVDLIPRNAMGKIERQKLNASYANQLNSGE